MTADASSRRASGSVSGDLTAGILATALWVVSRIMMAILWSLKETFIDHDVRYYYWQLMNQPMDQALIEYPTPIPLLLQGLRLVAGPNENAFLLAFVLVMVVIDGMATLWLWRAYSRRAAAYWAAFTFAIGSLIWFRIDLLPALAVLASLIWLTRRPAASGVAVALGAATKLWPAMLIVPMLGARGAERRRAAGFLIAGGALGLVSLLGFGWTRSVSPLTWQSDRGLQIESIVATVPMVRHGFGPAGQYYTELSQYNAWEIYGPQVDWWLGVADWLMVATIVLALCFGWLISLHGIGLPGRTLQGPADSGLAARRTHAIVLAQLAMICAVIVANKTFSPQYMIWLSAPLAIGVALPLPRWDRLAARVLAGFGLVTAALTHLVFPLNYSGLIDANPDPADVRLLVLRNGLMIVFTVLAIGLAGRAALAVGRPQPDWPAPVQDKPSN